MTSFPAPSPLCGRYTEDETISNWAETYTAEADYVFHPTTEEEVVAIVQWALSCTPPPIVRAVGAVHSPGPLPLPTRPGSDDTRERRLCVALQLDGMNRVVAFDRDAGVVEVGGGTRLWEINEFLAEVGMALPSLGSISDQSIAGAISTATHGTGVEFGNLSSGVTRLRMVTGTGEVVEADEDGSDEERTLLAAAACAMGALGIITRVAIRVVPEFRLAKRSFMVPIGDAIAELEHHAQASDHTKLNWFPHSGLAVVDYVDRVPQSTPRSVPEPSWWRDEILAHKATEAALYLASWVPFLEAPLCRAFVDWVVKPGLSDTPVVGNSVEIMNIDCLFRQYTTEWAVPRGKAQKALRLLKGFLDRSSFVKHFPIEIRFVRSDSVWLSPAYQGDVGDVVYIGIVIFRPYGNDVDIAEYWAGFEKIMDSVRGKPHWAKAHPLGARELEAKYSRMGDWARVCARLDPVGLFRNAVLDQTVALKSRL